MIVRDWDLLFSKHDLRAVLEHQLKSVDGKVRAIPGEHFETQSDGFISASIASDLVVSPLELHEERISVSTKEANIDVTRDPNRHFFGPGPHYIPGIEVTYHLPYSGQGVLWECRPHQFTLNPPRAVISREDLTFPIGSANRDVAATKVHFREHLSNIKQWLPWINNQVEEYNNQLEETVRRSVVARRQQLVKTKKDIESLGFPVKSGSPQPPQAAPKASDLLKRRAAKRAAARRQYDVALSFAGEDRDYVQGVAEALKAADVSVFYDRFETVDLWGKDLAAHLARIYSEDSHFVVMFVSRPYEEKGWPTHERQHALSRALKGDKERVLPVRMDDTEVPGLSPTIGYLDARVLTPAKLAELIRQKLDSE